MMIESESLQHEFNILIGFHWMIGDRQRHDQVKWLILDRLGVITGMGWDARCIPWHPQWVDLRENLQKTIDVLMKYGIFLQFFP